MQLFRSEDDVQAWSTATSIPVGDTFTVEQLWELAKRWYDDRFDLGWKRRTIAERQLILEEVGLSGDFWTLA